MIFLSLFCCSLAIPDQHFNTFVNKGSIYFCSQKELIQSLVETLLNCTEMHKNVINVLNGTEIEDQSEKEFFGDFLMSKSLTLLNDCPKAMDDVLNLIPKINNLFKAESLFDIFKQNPVDIKWVMSLYGEYKFYVLKTLILLDECQNMHADIIDILNVINETKPCHFENLKKSALPFGFKIMQKCPQALQLVMEVMEKGKDQSFIE